MDRSGLNNAQRGLLAAERWSWLEAFIDLWYSEPLRAEHGSSPADISGAALRTGLVVPPPLAEWWTLVGNRLIEVQDRPTRPASTEAVGDSLTLWRENQGVWTIAVRTDDSERCEVLDDGFSWPASATVPLGCRSMLMSDTLAGASFQTGYGPLGRLADGVTGSFIDDLTGPELADIIETYAELDLLAAPFWNEAPRGTDRIWVRLDGCTAAMANWATATPEAKQQLASIIELTRSG